MRSMQIDSPMNRPGTVSYTHLIIAYGVVFNLDKKTLAQMESDLKERRAKNEK